MVAAWLAAQHFNERNASIVPRFAELGACDVQLNLTLIDIHGDPKEAIDKYVHGREAYGFELIAGAYRSATSRPMAMLSPYHGVLQLGLSSSSPEFADASLFPYFSRCQPADDLSSEVIIEHVRLHGWRRIGLVRAREREREGERERGGVGRREEGTCARRGDARRERVCVTHPPDAPLARKRAPAPRSCTQTTPGARRSPRCFRRRARARCSTS